MVLTIVHIRKLFYVWTNTNWSLNVRPIVLHMNGIRTIRADIVMVDGSILSFSDPLTCVCHQIQQIILNNTLVHQYIMRFMRTWDNNGNQRSLTLREPYWPKPKRLLEYVLMMYDICESCLVWLKLRELKTLEEVGVASYKIFVSLAMSKWESWF